MAFVELDRSFVALRKDQEPSLEIGQHWGRKVGGWLDWTALLSHSRVVLLAEASSGKSEEFRHRAAALCADGKAGFFLAIEELADSGFELALGIGDAKAFGDWRSSTAAGWFFLDSLDEARLNRKSFEGAIKRFSRELGPDGLDRAHVFVSCRVTDWKGNEDRATIERCLPSWELAAVPTEDEDPNAGLLAPVFEKQERSSLLVKPARSPRDLQIVQLVPLSFEQYRSLAADAGVTDIDGFSTAIGQRGLEGFTGRPGDVLELARYWKTHGRLGTFAEMVADGVGRKLTELDPFRADNAVLASEKAWLGAERLAAALTLGKSFTLHAPSYSPDPDLPLDAVEPAQVLDEWSDAERNALLRRGIFTPASYGRVRFHHRSTQEFLTARWLDRLLRANCPMDDIWQLIFADRYDVPTVVPSLRPAVAWLSLWHPDILRETIQREPLVLLRHGDPGSLPLDARKDLLAAYAARHAAAEIADDSLDHRALWMFADPGLADAIREAWQTNTRPEFRHDLVRLIREGGIRACSDLPRGVAEDQSADEYHRSTAAEALSDCNDAAGLDALGRLVMQSTASLGPRLASRLAVVLYPRHLSARELLTLIEESQPRGESTVEGFAYRIFELYRAAPNAEARTAFVMGVADLCLSPPFHSDYELISERYHDIAQHLAPIARQEIEAMGNGEAPLGLVRVLMALERAPENLRGENEALALRQLVCTRPRLNRSLFWADVAHQRANAQPSDKAPIRFRQIYLGGGEQLWELSKLDTEWLWADVAGRQLEDDRRIALSGLISVLKHEGRLNSELDRLHALTAHSTLLASDLEQYLVGPAPDEQRLRWERDDQKRKEQQAARLSEEKAGLVALCNTLKANPSQLRDPERLLSWEAGIFRLQPLAVWLQHRTGKYLDAAPREWRLLEEGFGRAVAEAFRDGMKVVWRNIAPERPKWTTGSAVTVKNSTLLAFAGIGVESDCDPDWTARLTGEEAARAAAHGCLSEQGYPDWIDALVNSHPQAALPVLRQEIANEWGASEGSRSTFLDRYSSPAYRVQEPVREILLEQFFEREAGNPAVLTLLIGILRGLDLGSEARARLLSASIQRRAEHLKAGRDDFAIQHLAMTFILEPERAAAEFVSWIEGQDAHLQKEMTEHALAVLFDRHNPLVSGVLGRTSVKALETLLEFAYQQIRPEDDAFHEGVFSSNDRDRAEGARHAILSALLDRPGGDAYRSIQRLLARPAFQSRIFRFKELARGKAERDAEMPPWTGAEVLAFERKHTAPVKTGADLYRLVRGVLKDVFFGLTKADYSSRALLEQADNEEVVQHWLAEQIDARRRGRFHVHREAQVAQNDRPDIIVASTSSQAEVGIEIKHGGKGWTVRELETALRNQLAEDYLKPSTRRHGVLVITNHSDRRWKHPETGASLTFADLIHRLERLAATIVENTSGAIEVTCVGLDAWRAPKASKPGGRKRTARARKATGKVQPLNDPA